MPPYQPIFIKQSEALIPPYYSKPTFISTMCSSFPHKSRKENPQKLTQLSPRFHPRHLVGKRTAQKDAIKDFTSDSQVNSYFPYRLSLASLTINIYFYIFLYLYITKKTINNGTQNLKSLKNQKRRAASERPAIKLLGSTNPRT